MGETSGLTGKKISKNDIVIHFLGEADELNAHLGMVKAMLSGDDEFFVYSRQFLVNIQINLMTLMSHVSDTSNDNYHFHGDEVNVLEKEIDRLSENLPEIKQLIIPGENILEAQIHLARTAARKLERTFFSVNENHPLCPQASTYLNRLSDYLFILSQQFLPLNSR